jgi:hypothetical protein
MEESRCERPRFDAGRVWQIPTPRRRRPRREQCQLRFCDLSLSSSCGTLSWLMGDGDVVLRPFAVPHKRNSKRCFSHAYAVSSERSIVLIARDFYLRCRWMPTRICNPWSARSHRVLCDEYRFCVRSGFVKQRTFRSIIGVVMYAVVRNDRAYGFSFRSLRVFSTEIPVSSA